MQEGGIAKLLFGKGESVQGEDSSEERMQLVENASSDGSNPEVQ